MLEHGKGVFYAVSVGPGDPDMVTLGALRCIENSPVLAAPITVSGQMLALDIVTQITDVANKTIVPMSFQMSRDRAVLDAQHRKLAEELATHLDQGSDVAMINIGDVSVYSTCFYILEELAEMGYRTEMISGVTSFCAVASRLGISLTTRDEPVHILPGNYDMEEALEMPGTKIIMKSGKQLPEVIAKIQEKGLGARAGMVANCGMDNEKIFPNLEEGADSIGKEYFVTIIVK